MSSAKRALVVVAAVVCVAAVGAAVRIYRWHRPLAGPSAGSAPSILNQLPPDAPAFAYIDVAALRRLHDSPLAAMLGVAGANPQQDRDYRDFVRDTGFDYTRDLDRAAIAFWPSGAPTTSRGAAENRTLAIADGRFDQSKITAYALRTGRAITAGQRPVYFVPGNPDITFKFVSATRIALASGPENVLSAETEPKPRDPAMQERISRVAGAPIFAVARADNMPPGFYDGLRSAPQFENVARSIQGLTLAGQPDGGVIHVTLDAECDSMTNAIELATVVESLRLLGSMALADPKARAQMNKEQLAFLNALLNQAKVTHQDRIVRLVLDVTPAMLGESKPGPHAQMRGAPQGLKPLFHFAANVGAPFGGPQDKEAPTP